MSALEKVPLLGAPAGAELLVILVVLAMPATWIWSIVDAVRYTDSDYKTAGQNKTVWVLVIVFLGLLGTLIYACAARPSLKRAATS